MCAKMPVYFSNVPETAETYTRRRVERMRKDAAQSRKDAAWCAKQACEREIAAMYYRAAEASALAFAEVTETEAAALEKEIRPS